MEKLIDNISTEGGLAISILLLVILGMAWFIRVLVNRNTTLSDKTLDIAERSIQAMTEMKTIVLQMNEYLKEVVRNVR